MSQCYVIGHVCSILTHVTKQSSRLYLMQINMLEKNKLSLFFPHFLTLTFCFACLPFSLPLSLAITDIQILYAFRLSYTHVVLQILFIFIHLFRLDIWIGYMVCYCIILLVIKFTGFIHTIHRCPYINIYAIIKY